MEKMNELGAAVRRFVGRQPVRLRYQTQEQRFLLQARALPRSCATRARCSCAAPWTLRHSCSTLTRSWNPGGRRPLSRWALYVSKLLLRSNTETRPDASAERVKKPRIGRGPSRPPRVPHRIGGTLTESVAVHRARRGCLIASTCAAL